ncbi:MAG TPA: dihydropteroate synthase [Candidatus Avibacteroides faecavium]|nr:dihydropteroate synthase [Candidatus Avibacteroides faecavium]
MKQTTASINLAGNLVQLDKPLVMGILNVTPDSFYPASRTEGDAEIAARAKQIIDEGGSIIDIGAYSSRPGADDVPPEEEMRRLAHALRIIRQAVGDAVCSVDTFRADVARMCVEEYGVAMVNDISGGELDGAMFDTVARLKVPYVLMHMKGTPKDMQHDPAYEDVLGEVMQYLAGKVATLNDKGVSDIVIDPGFGFGKTLDDNYRLMAHLDLFKELGCPLLVGVSRKSMICKLLGITADDALNGTTALDTFALMKGADILRVHDVRQAVEAVEITGKLKQFG